MSELNEFYPRLSTIPPYSNAEFEKLLGKLPIRAEIPEWMPLLSDLQANILLHHGKKFSRFLAIHFKSGANNVQKALAWIEQVAPNVTSAIAQMEDPQHPVCTFYLTWQGYRSLMLDHLAPAVNDNAAFAAGISGRTPFPKPDEPTNSFPGLGKEEIHALVMIASDMPDFRDVDGLHEIAEITGHIDWAVVKTHDGILKKRQFNHKDEQGRPVPKVVEWFGFRDGISQPLFFPDLSGNSSFTEKSLMPLRAVLLKDKGGDQWCSAGSFMTFLKLEQNVRAFKQNADNIEKKITGISRERAEAYMMGRFHDGTSVSLHDAPKNYIEKSPENDFSYLNVQKGPDGEMRSDHDGIRCPFAAHARKANPRDRNDSVTIVRRGVLYDDRMPDGHEEKDVEWQDWPDDLNQLPEKDLGLLFMSFQSNIGKQFEYILNRWMNNVYTGKQQTGVDMVTGTGLDHQFSTWFLPEQWGKGNVDNKVRFTAEDLKPCIRFLGGAYFFAPSRSFLKNVQKNSFSFARLKNGVTEPGDGNNRHIEF